MRRSAALVSHFFHTHTLGRRFKFLTKRWFLVTRSFFGAFIVSALPSCARPSPTTGCTAPHAHTVVLIVRRYIFTVVVESTLTHDDANGASDLPCAATQRTASVSASIEVVSTDHASACSASPPPQLTAWHDVSLTVPFEFAASPGRSTIVPSNRSWGLVDGALADRNLAFVRGAIAENSVSASCLNDSGTTVLAFWNVRPVTFSTGFDDSEDYTVGPWSDSHAKEPWTEILVSSDDIVSTLTLLGVLNDTTAHGLPSSVDIELLCKLHLEVIFFGQAALEVGLAGGNSYVQVQKVERLLASPTTTTAGGDEAERDSFLLNVTYRRMDAAAHTDTPALRRFHFMGAVAATATAGTTPVDNLPALPEERISYSLFVALKYSLVLVLVLVLSFLFSFWFLFLFLFLCCGRKHIPVCSFFPFVHVRKNICTLPA